MNWITRGRSKMSVNLDLKLDVAYEKVLASQYNKPNQCSKVIGLFKFLEGDFNPVNQIFVEHNAVACEVIFTKKGDAFKINCCNSPNFDNKSELYGWMTDQLKSVEVYWGVKLIKENQFGRVQGIRIN